MRCPAAPYVLLHYEGWALARGGGIHGYRYIHGVKEQTDKNTVLGAAGQ